MKPLAIRSTVQAAVFVVSIAASTTPARSADWPQWRGPARDGHAPAAAGVDWTAAPRKVWSVRVGAGHSGPVVAANRVVQHVHSGGREVVIGLDLATGREVWRDSYAVTFTQKAEAAAHGVGPYATPTIAEGRVFTFGVSEILSAYDVATGKLLWRRDWSKEFGEPHPLYGASSPPLVDRQNVIAYVGGPGNGALVAHDVKTGAIRWRHAGEGPGYGAPVAGSIGGVRQIVTLTQNQLIGVDAQSGARLWKHPFPVGYDVTAVTPVLDGDNILLSAYDIDLQAIAIRKDGATWSAAVAWKLRQPTYMSSAVVADGRAYGLTHLRRGQLFAVDAKTGKTVWTSEPGVGEYAVLTAAGDKLLAITTEGDLRVVERGDAYRAVAKHTLAEGPIWAPPAVLDGGRLLVKDATTLTLWSFGEARRP